MHEFLSDWLCGFDLDLESSKIATIDTAGVFLISTVDSNECLLHKKLIGKKGDLEFINLML